MTAYLCEGTTRNRNRLAIANSDPAVIVLAASWFRRLAPDRKLRPSIQYHADQDLDKLTQFWAGVIPVAASEITLQRKANSGRMAGRTWRSEHGVLTLTVLDTLLRARMQAWMDRIRGEWTLDCASPHGV